MIITLNGEQRELSSAVSVAVLLVELDMEGRRLAIEINGEIVPRSRYSEHLLKDGNIVEIVRAIGGG